MALFRIIEDDAPEPLERRAFRLGGCGCAIAFILPPALLLVSFGIYVLIDFVPGAVTDSPALDEMPARDRVVALAVMAAIAVPLMALARKFILGRRRLVLFLRRFGDRGSLAMVTQAATGAPGSGYRLVTLDDRSTVGVGVEKTLAVKDDKSLEVALKRVRRLSRRLFGPKAVFLHVDDPIWRSVVLRLVAETNAVLIDVTEPGPNLLWEIETVGSIVRPWWILVGERDALTDLANLDLNDRETTSWTTLAGLLRGEDVLAYRIGEDQDRFGRVVQAKYDLVTRHRPDRMTGPVVEDIPPQDLTPVEVAQPYDLAGPPAPWWPGREADLPSEGPGSLASMGERWAARGIDLGIGLFVLLALVWIERATRAIAQLPESGGDWLRTLTSAALLILIVAYDPVSTLLLGATPGKRLLHLEVVRAGNHEPASVVLVGARGLIQVAVWMCCVVPGVLDAIAGASHPLKQTWHDRWAATLVVRAPPHGS
ncbi:MAG TPA: RDD family protein [Acidimicrobiia bacterium]|nr:RDD family protein [Acidimicrobiia bacterium]